MKNYKRTETGKRWTDVNQAVWERLGPQFDTKRLKVIYLLVLALFMDYQSFFFWNPFSSEGGMNFNDWFVPVPNDKGERAEQIPFPPFILCLFILIFFYSHFERLRGWIALLHAISERLVLSSVMPNLRQENGKWSWKGGAAQLCGGGGNVFKDKVVFTLVITCCHRQTSDAAAATSLIATSVNSVWVTISKHKLIPTSLHFE